jgi:hypothetical protein
MGCSLIMPASVLSSALSPTINTTGCPRCACDGRRSSATLHCLSLIRCFDCDDTPFGPVFGPAHGFACGCDDVCGGDAFVKRL